MLIELFFVSIQSSSYLGFTVLLLFLPIILNNLFGVLCITYSSAIPVFGWNVTILQPYSANFTLQWTRLDAYVNHSAKFYIIEVKSAQGVLLTTEIVPGHAASAVVERLRPSTKYRVVVFGVDETGQPYKSLERGVRTNKGKTNCITCIYLFLNNTWYYEIVCYLAFIGAKRWWFCSTTAGN